MEKGMARMRVGGRERGNVDQRGSSMRFIKGVTLLLLHDVSIIPPPTSPKSGSGWN